MPGSNRIPHRPVSEGRTRTSRQAVAPIIVLDDQISEEDSPGFTLPPTACGPSRGEGWGRTPMEAMASGLPTIATGWGGTQEFMTRENSLLIDSEMVRIDARCEMPFYHRQSWAEPSFEHLALLLRQIVERPQMAAEIGARARRETVEKWSWERVVDLSENRMRETETEPGRESAKCEVTRQATHALPSRDPRSMSPLAGPERRPGFSFCVITNGKRPEKLREEIKAFVRLGFLVMKSWSEVTFRLDSTTS